LNAHQIELRREQSAERVAHGQYRAIRHPESYIEAYENHRYWLMRYLRKEVRMSRVNRAIRILRSYL